MELGITQLSDGLLGKLRLTRIHELDELESGSYWAQLRPYFLKPYFKRLTYRLSGRNPRPEVRGEALSTRGAGGLDGLDIAYVADRFATVLSISETGLPDYCLTSISRGALEYQGATSPKAIDIGATSGLIYRGLPGTRLSAKDDNERLAIWIPASGLEQRLTALLGDPSKDALEFRPCFDWRSEQGRAVRRLVWLLTEELASPHSFALNDIARRSFTDLLLYSLLQSLPHNHTERLTRAVGSLAPRTVRKAEAFIHSRAGQPIALHEVADAAGCSVRALQLGFRRFRDTTPAAVIRRARLEAVRQALVCGGVEGTVGDLAHCYGFTNPARFTRLYKEAFGTSPIEALQHRSRPRTSRR